MHYLVYIRYLCANACGTDIYAYCIEKKARTKTMDYIMGKNGEVLSIRTTISIPFVWLLSGYHFYLTSIAR